MRVAAIAAGLLAAASAENYDETVAETAQLDEDPYQACVEEYGCYKFEGEEHEMCMKNCHEVEDNAEEDDVWGCIMEFCDHEINNCMANDQCSTEASEEHSRVECVMNHFEGCTADFQFAFQCYVSNCFHESHIPHLHSGEGITADDIHHIAANGHHSYDENVAATAEMDEDPYHACMEEYGCYQFENEHEFHKCEEQCHQVEENAEEEDVWGCLMANCEHEINECMSNDACMNEASEEHTRMTCVTDRFEGCTAEFQFAFACYMDNCFHESHIPYLHHDEVTVDDLHDIAHNGHHSHTHDDHSGEYHDEEANQVHVEEEQWEEDEKHHDEEENELYEEHKEHHEHHCPHFDESYECDPHQCYENGWCEVRCPEGFSEHDGSCINEHCPHGQHIIMDWESHPAKPYCADVTPVEIVDKIAYWNEDGSNTECWNMGEGWEHRWLPGPNDHWDEWCVKFADCAEEETRAWGIHGKQYCSANHVAEHCEGQWSDMWDDEAGHRRVCVQGERVDCGSEGHVIVDWGSEGEPAVFCINATPVEMVEYEPVLLTFEDRGETSDMGCEEAGPDGTCNHHTWYCNGNCEHADCWSKGDGWQDTWEHGRQACVKYADCAQHEARVHNLRGQTLCTADHHTPYCNGAWSWMYSPKRGHHVRVCVEGHEAEVSERSNQFHSHHHHHDDHHHHESNEDDVWGCLKENCGEALEMCWNDAICGEVVQDDGKREYCMEKGFPEEDCSAHLLPLFECYIQQCEH